MTPSSYGQVAVLMGGNSNEREISLQSGHAVLRALLELSIDAFAFDTKHESLTGLKNITLLLYVYMAKMVKMAKFKVFWMRWE